MQIFDVAAPLQGDSVCGRPSRPPSLAPAQPMPAWQGVRDASKFGADCAQRGFGSGGASIRENSRRIACFSMCGNLPGQSRRQNCSHGVDPRGAFVFAADPRRTFSRAQFARQGVILVTFNYRLGRLGFFAFPALSKEQPEETQGQLRLHGPNCRLKWVRQNIAAFGGNPKT